MWPCGRGVATGVTYRVQQAPSERSGLPDQERHRYITKWPRNGSRFLILATGKDFKITYDSAEAIREGRITQLPSNEAVMSEFLRKVEHQIMLSMLSEAHILPGKNLAELFPEVQPTNIEDFFRAGWKLKQNALSK